MSSEHAVRLCWNLERMIAISTAAMLRVCSQRLEATLRRSSGRTRLEVGRGEGRRGAAGGGPRAVFFFWTGEREVAGTSVAQTFDGPFSVVSIGSRILQLHIFQCIIIISVSSSLLLVSSSSSSLYLVEKEPCHHQCIF